MRDDRGGMNRAMAILLVLIAVMVVVVAVPSWQWFRYRSERIGCQQAMKSAGDGLIIEYLSRWEASSVEEVYDTLDEVMPAREELCPAGGVIYLVKGEDGIYEPVCGLHDPDKMQKTRLNASYARELLTDGLRAQRRLSETEPESVEITLNGDPLECIRVPVEEAIHRGTKTTKGYKGVVAYYGIAGDGEFSTGAVEEGEICYFVYADEEYCAIWRADDGWTGTAYDGI